MKVLRLRPCEMTSRKKYTAAVSPAAFGPADSCKAYLHQRRSDLLQNRPHGLCFSATLSIDFTVTSHIGEALRKKKTSICWWCQCGLFWSSAVNKGFKPTYASINNVTFIKHFPEAASKKQCFGPFSNVLLLFLHLFLVLVNHLQVQDNRISTECDNAAVCAIWSKWKYLIGLDTCWGLHRKDQYI